MTLTTRRTRRGPVNQSLSTRALLVLRRGRIFKTICKNTCHADSRVGRRICRIARRKSRACSDTLQVCGSSLEEGRILSGRLARRRGHRSSLNCGKSVMLETAPPNDKCEGIMPAIFGVRNRLCKVA